MMMAFLSDMQICLFKKLHGELSAWCAHHLSFDYREQQLLQSAISAAAVVAADHFAVQQRACSCAVFTSVLG